MIAVVLRLDRRRDETPGTEYRRTDALGIAHARVTDAVLAALTGLDAEGLGGRIAVGVAQRHNIRCALDINQISASSRPTGYS